MGQIFRQLFQYLPSKSFTPVVFYGVKSLSQNMGTLSPSGLMGPVRLEMLHLSTQ